MKRLVQGVGVNDMKGMSGTEACRAWASMLRRCYSAKLHVDRPTYIDCEVCEEWKTFSNFYAWYVKQDIPEGWQLDKDILTDSKVYSPETCVFVTRQVNTLFNDRKAARGEWPEGVDFDRGKFRAQLATGDGKRKTLGRYATPEEAHEVYCKAKLKYCYEVADEVEADERFDPRVAPAIRAKAEAKYERLLVAV